MSSDSPTPSTSPESARALGRWLDRPSEAPPEGVDAEVLEAIYALRPELAPAPRVSPDDILAGVTRGPLAADAEAPTPASVSRDGAEIVPFPGQDGSSEGTEGAAAEVPPRPADAAPPGARGPQRAAAWARGTAGVGIALVAAATLMIVVGTGREDGAATRAAPEQGIAARELATSDEATDGASGPHKVEIADQIAERQAPPSLEARAPAPPPARAAPAPKATARAEGATGAEEAEEEPEQAAALRDELVAQGYYRIDEDAFDAEQARIPEVAGEAPAELREAPEAAPAAGVAAGGGRRARSRAVAAPADADEPTHVADDALVPAPVGAGEADAPVRPAVPRPSAAWSAGVDGPVVEEVRGLLSRADALAAEGRRADAARVLADGLRGPAGVAHHLAMRAAELYLQAGAPQRALEVLDRGLSFAGGDAGQRRYLQLLRGDAALAAGKPAEAREIWSALQ